jgi:K(+)-stimulated pyrophosphate-energized sodium pump
MKSNSPGGSLGGRITKALLASLTLFVALLGAGSAFAKGVALAAPVHAGGEDSLSIPAELDTIQFFGLPAARLLQLGFIVTALGIVFGLVIYNQLKNAPAHKSMKDVSELIFETCKTYLWTQAKFLAQLWLFIGAVIVIYYGFLKGEGAGIVLLILAFSIVGIAGSALVALFGIRVNTFANSRTAFASLKGNPFPCYSIPLKAGMSIGMLLISVELAFMLGILTLVPHAYAGKCFIGFAIGESLGAAALRVAGGIFTKIADIGSDLMKIVFKIKEDDARNPGVIADCTGDNAGDSVGPSADGFETYGVTGVALIVFILLAVHDPDVQVHLLTWIFVMRILMIVSSALSYYVNEAITKARYGDAKKMDFEAPLTQLVWITSIVSIIFTFIASKFLVPMLGGDDSQWWKLSVIITCGTLAGALIPELIKVFTSTKSGHVREVVTASKEGGPSLNVLSGLVAGNFSAYWMGMTLLVLMGIAYFVSQMGLGATMTIGSFDTAPIFSFGLVAFGFLGMGPVTLAVDSYGPVTDNAQSVFELSMIETIPGIAAEIKNDFGFDVDFEKGKELLEENDGAGNTFKATAKPVLIGTAVVGATTMIFAIIVLLTDGLQNPERVQKLSLLYPPFLLGLIAGGSVIYWFTGASIQAVSTGAYRAVEFIKANIKLEGSEKASLTDSKKVVEICTTYAQKGMFNIFLVVFFSALAFAFLDPFFFVGYLIAIALFGLFQALFMANAGGAWDNAKKIVETDLKQKGTDLHAACVVGDTVGDPFKDTSSVALNPIIKFTTLFGLLAVELANDPAHPIERDTTAAIAAICLAVAVYFVWRSFYGMRIVAQPKAAVAEVSPKPAE